MESISTITSVISHKNTSPSQEKIIPVNEISIGEKQSNTSSNNKYLQPDKVEISEASLKKLSESEEEDQKKSLNITDELKTKEDAEAISKTNESDIDEEIRELSLEILELTIKIEMLKAKEDKESVEERQALEVELAIKKGTLEATINRKLQMATLASN
jgi:hypothetical protein